MVYRNPAQYLLVEDQLANMWQMVFPTMPNLDLQLVSTNIPFPKLTYDGKSYGLKSYNSITPPETVSFTFREQETFVGYRYFQSWLDSIYDYRRKQWKVLANPRIKYRTATIQYLTKVGGSLYSIPNFSFTLKNLMPLGFSELPVDNENGSPLQFTIEMAVESVEPLTSRITNVVSSISSLFT